MNYHGHIVAGTLTLSGSSAALLLTGSTTADNLAIYILTFTIATFWLSPDLDLPHSRCTKNWGPLSFLWRPYSILFTHRGLSHSIFFSTLSRLAYMLFGCASIYLTVFLCLTETPTYPLDFLQDALVPIQAVAIENFELIVAAVSGWVASDLTHIILDRFSSMLKRIF